MHDISFRKKFSGLSPKFRNSFTHFESVGPQLPTFISRFTVHICKKSRSPLLDRLGDLLSTKRFDRFKRLLFRFIREPLFPRPDKTWHTFRQMCLPTVRLERNIKSFLNTRLPKTASISLTFCLTTRFYSRAIQAARAESCRGSVRRRRAAPGQNRCPPKPSSFPKWREGFPYAPVRRGGIPPHY